MWLMDGESSLRWIFKSHYLLLRFVNTTHCRCSFPVTRLQFWKAFTVHHAPCRLNNSSHRRSSWKSHFYFIEGSSGVAAADQDESRNFLCLGLPGWSIEIFCSFELTSMSECLTEDTDHCGFSQLPIKSTSCNRLGTGFLYGYVPAFPFRYNVMATLRKVLYQHMFLLFYN